MDNLERYEAYLKKALEEANDEVKDDQVAGLRYPPIKHVLYLQQLLGALQSWKRKFVYSK